MSDTGEPEVLRSRQNHRVQAARRLARDPRQARSEGLLLADGTTLVREALESGLPSRAIYLDPADPEAVAIRAEASLRRIPVTFATPEILQVISTLRTAQGALGIFERPVHDLAHLLAAPGAAGHPLIAILHGLQDPTNVGALIRSALAAGLAGTVTTEGTCDPFHPRAVRASMGACFRLSIRADEPAGPLWDLLRRNDYRLLALAPRGEIALSDCRLDRPTALLLGQEGSGLEAEARAACHGALRIPMARGIDSYGVAAAGAIAFQALGMPRDP